MPSGPRTPATRVSELVRTLRDPDLRDEKIVHALIRAAERRSGMTYIGLDYPPSAASAPRFGWGKPPHAAIAQRLASGHAEYAARLRELMGFEEDLARIGLEPTSAEPGWIQHPPWMLGLDGISLYGFLRLGSPARYLEVGSGNSTKFASRARRDGHLPTRLLSIDPHPRAEIDTLCDEVHRAPLEASDLSLFATLEAGDVVFFDGSHRSFMNSDVTVFFLEVLPSLAPGVLVGVHDIFLPADYPPQWRARYYNEQYLLACQLLADRPSITPVLPCYYVGLVPELSEILAPLWQREELRGVDARGFTFWFTVGADGPP